MQMTWKQACLRVNPDPSWRPKRGSEDYKKVAEIWGKENAQASWDKTAYFPPKPTTVPGFVPEGRLHARQPTLFVRKKLSKADYLADPEVFKTIQTYMHEIHKSLKEKCCPKIEPKNAPQAHVRGRKEKGVGTDEGRQGQA